MWLDSKAVNCPQKWGNFKPVDLTMPISALNLPLSAAGKQDNNRA